MNGLIALALITGILAPLNPCGFVLLPAYLAYQSSSGEAGLARRLAHGLRSGFAVTVGFTTAFALAAAAVAVGLRALIDTAPWLGIIVGVLVAAAGVWSLSGRALPSLRLPGVPRIGAAGSGGAGRFAVFGIAYAAASLSCALPLLMAFVAQASAGPALPHLIWIFLAFATGVGAVLVPLSIVTALAAGAPASAARRLFPVLPKVTGAVLALTGIYLVVYWAPVAGGGSADTSAPGRLVNSVAVSVTGWVSNHQAITLSVAIAVLVSAIVGVVAVPRKGLERNEN